MAVPDGELDLPVPVPRAPRSRPVRPWDQQRARTGPPASVQLAAFLLLLAPVPAAVAGWFLAGALGFPPQAGAVPGFGVHQLLQEFVVVPALVWRRSQPCGAQVRERVAPVGGCLGVTVSDVRTLGSRQGRVRSVGVLLRPRGRVWVLVAEDLAATNPADLDALVAHQLARARATAYRLVLPLMLVVWVALVVLAGQVAPGGGPGLAILTALTAFPSILLTQAWCMDRGDRQADRRAAPVVGARRLADALDGQQRGGELWPPGSVCGFSLPVRSLGCLNVSRVCGAGPTAVDLREPDEIAVAPTATHTVTRPRTSPECGARSLETEDQTASRSICGG